LIFGQFKEPNRLLPRDGGKVAEKAVERIALFDVVEQGLNRYARAGKARCAMHDLGINRNHPGNTCSLFCGHILKVSQVLKARKSEQDRRSAFAFISFFLYMYKVPCGRAQAVKGARDLRVHRNPVIAGRRPLMVEDDRIRWLARVVFALSAERDKV
jgi:hypothetical protein